MTLPSSGSITSTQLVAELGLAAGTPISIPSVPIRNLAGRQAGNITWPTDFYGQTKDGICTEQNTTADVTSGGVASMVHNYGATSWNRRIAVCLAWGCNVNAVETGIIAATIGGQSCAIHVQNGQGGSSSLTNYGCAIISAIVPTGASGNTVVTFNNSTVRNVYGTAFRATGITTGAALDTASAFAEDSSAPFDATAAGVINRANNYLEFIAGVAAGGSIPGLAITGATERVDAQGVTNFSGDFERYGFGMSFGGPSQGSSPCSVRATSDAGTLRVRMVAASFALL